MTSTQDPADRRLAAQLASDSAKSLLQIGVATFVISSGYLQFLVSKGVSLKALPSGLVEGGIFLTVVSMICGFGAMSGIYKRVEGRVVEEGGWSTEHVRGLLDGQAWTGLAALAMLLAGVLTSPELITASPSP